VRAFGELSKFKLTGFVVSTSCAGFALGSGATVDLQGLAWTAAGTWGAAACANTLNQVVEVRSDALMKRTRHRPLPAGALSRRSALLFAAGAGVAGVGALWSHCSATAAALGAANVVLYAAVYTPLKRISVVNTWVGAVVGAIPPLIGWAAAAGELQPGAGVLAGALYLWQLPHFMALAYLYRADYAAGGYRMLPILDATGRRTAGVMLRNSAALLPLGFAAAALGVASPPFAWEAAALSAALLAGAGAFWLAPGQVTARRLFLASLLHLPLLQGALVLHRIPNTAQARADAPTTMSEWLRRARAAHAADSIPAREDTIRLAMPALSAAPFPFLPLPLVQAPPSRRSTTASSSPGT